MLKININGNRSDIIGYVSYYSSEEIANLLGVNQDEIIYETTVTDYFMHGDITFETEVIVHVTLTDNYFDRIQELTNIIVKYVGFFTSKCKVYYDVIDSRLVYIYDNKGKKHGCGCNHEEEHCCHHHHEDHECHCHEDGCECNCGDECDCSCHEDGCKCHHNEE
jgi:hypothetical protein